MKHRLTTLALVLLLLLTLTACSAAGPAAAPDAANAAQLEQKLDALENKLDSLEAALRQAAAPAPQPEAPATPAPAATEAPAVQPEPAVQIPAEPAQAAKLTQEEAEKIALDHVGFTADQVERMRSNFEIDDRIPQYDVEFLQGDWEYEFEIHAETGNIISYDKDHKYD